MAAEKLSVGSSRGLMYRLTLPFAADLDDLDECTDETSEKTTVFSECWSDLSSIYISKNYSSFVAKTFRTEFVLFRISNGTFMLIISITKVERFLPPWLLMLRLTMWGDFGGFIEKHSFLISLPDIFFLGWPTSKNCSFATRLGVNYSDLLSLFLSCSSSQSNFAMITEGLFEL